MSQNGVGVMLGILGGNEKTVNTVKSSLNKTIKKVWLDEETDRLNFKFTDGTGMYLFDDARRSGAVEDSEAYSIERLAYVA